MIRCKRISKYGNDLTIYGPSPLDKLYIQAFIDYALKKIPLSLRKMRREELSQ
jgi:hypothetical protein